MKSIVLYQLVNKQYYLGSSYRSSFHRYHKMPVDYIYDDEGFVRSEEIHSAWCIELETERFIREFDEDELINIEGKNYKIIKVAHREDGSILYYIDKTVANEDLESKKKAEQDLETRKLILDERKKQLEQQISTDELKKSNKKWYKFW